MQKTKSNKKTDKTTPKQTRSKAVIFAVAGWVLIGIAVVLAVGFYAGHEYAQSQQAQVNTQVQQMTATLKN